MNMQQIKGDKTKRVYPNHSCSTSEYKEQCIAFAYALCLSQNYHHFATLFHGTHTYTHRGEAAMHTFSPLWPQHWFSFKSALLSETRVQMEGKVWCLYQGYGSTPKFHWKDNLISKVQEKLVYAFLLPSIQKTHRHSLDNTTSIKGPKVA